MSTKSNPKPETPAQVSEVLDMATSHAKGNLPADGRSSAKAALTTEVTTYSAEGKGETKVASYDASVSLGTMTTTKEAVKPCACGHVPCSSCSQPAPAVPAPAPASGKGNKS